MSSIGRAASRGSKSGKVDSVSNKSQKTDGRTETLKTDNSKAQPTAEQMRIAQIIDGKIDDPSLKEKIQQVIDATQKSELEACAALHDCDNDLDRAVNLLMEGPPQGWEVSVKKKKNRLPSVNSKAETSTKAVAGDTEDNWDDETPAKPPTDGPQPRTRPRGSGGPPRMRGRGSLDNRGWRGRENKENERNLESGSGVGPGGDRDRDRDRDRDGFRRGGGGGRGGRMSNGPSRGGGRGGSRMGPRTFQSRGGDRSGGGSSGGFPRSIETWNNPDHESTTTENKAATFAEDWDNEEYTGSLADTKVFTPSTAGMPDGSSTGPASVAQVVANAGAGEVSLDAVNSNTNSGLELHSAPSNTLLSQSPVTAGGLALNPAQSQYLSQLTRDSQLSNQLSNQISSQLSNQLSNAADDQKLATLSLAGTTAATSVSNAPASYAGSYSANTYAASAAQSSMYSAAAAAAAGVSNDGVYAGYQAPQSQSASYSNAYSGQDRGSTQPASASQPLPARTKTQRAKMPAPSKIPSSAVEMPGDAVNSGISFLDVQFGGLDLCSETFDTNSTASEPQASPQPSQNQTKFSGGSAGADSSTASAAQASLDVSAQSPLDSYSKSSLSQSLTMNNAGFILQQSQQGSGTQQQSTSQSQQQSNDIKGSQSAGYAQQSRVPSGVGSSLEGLVKSDGISSSNASSGNTSASHAYSGTTSSYQSNYQSQKNSSSGYQPSYNASSNYSQSQVTSAATGYSSNQAPSSYTNSSYSSSTAPSNAYQSNSYGNAQSSSSGYSTSSGATPSGSTSAATTYPSISQPAAYPASVASQAYQSGVYGNSSGSNTGTASVLGSNSGYTTSSSTPYQNSYSAPTASNKLSSSLSSGTKDQQFDATATASSTLSNSVSGAVSASPALGLTAVNNATSTKVSTSAAKSSVVANMPPGMQPIMTGTPQYIINQGGLPYFAQQPVYSYDEQQLLQLRLQPHMTTGYYDIPFQQAPTSLAAGREGSIASVQYSMSDGRFARTDNASPVPSSVSQQQNATQPHQQPMMNAASFPQGYAYYYSSLPNYQYGTPMYPPVAPATNAHGNSNTTQYTKQGNYGSGYGLGYEGLSGSQDYSKPGGYVSGSQTGSKTGVGANAPSTGASGSDLYTKGHVALSKVNSYEKQGFHSGTPPPPSYLTNSQSTGFAPSGAMPPHLFIPTIPPHHQQHSTTLMHQPLHQDSGTSSGQRSQSSTQPNKAGAKQTYSPSYWTPN